MKRLFTILSAVSVILWIRSFLVTDNWEWGNTSNTREVFVNDGRLYVGNIHGPWLTGPESITYTRSPALFDITETTYLLSKTRPLTVGFWSGGLRGGSRFPSWVLVVNFGPFVIGSVTLSVWWIAKSFASRSRKRFGLCSRCG